MDKYRAYAVVIPDDDESFEALMVEGPVISWGEITTEATTIEIAEVAIEEVSEWWKSL